MKEVSRPQEREMFSRFMTQVHWNEIDGDYLQDEVINLSPEEFGKRFTAFLKNGCRFNFGDPKSFLAKPFDPVKFLGKGWSILEDIKTDAEIDVSSMVFETCLEGDETSIKGEKKLLRLKAKKDFTSFCANVFMGLWLDYQANKENSILEFLYRTKKIQYLDFFGTVLRDPDGYRCVLCLCRSADGAWSWYCYWLDYDWNPRHLSAGRAS